MLISFVILYTFITIARQFPFDDISMIVRMGQDIRIYHVCEGGIDYKNLSLV